MKIKAPYIAHALGPKLCGKQQLVDKLPRTFVRCTRRKHHKGKHSWEQSNG